MKECYRRQRVHSAAERKEGEETGIKEAWLEVSLYLSRPGPARFREGSDGSALDFVSDVGGDLEIGCVCEGTDHVLVI